MIQRKPFTKTDIFILSAILLIAAAGYAFMNRAAGEGGLNALIYLDGELMETVSLDRDSAFSLETLPGVGFAVKDGAAAIVRSDCPDQLCVHMGWQRSPAGFSACLPNRVTLVIEEARSAEYQRIFTDLFDTTVVFRAAAKNPEEFDAYADAVSDELGRLHKLFDVYNDYDGLNNLKTVNAQAGVSAVEADAELLDLIELGIEAYEKSGGAVNIAMGACLSIWHDYREDGTAVPPAEALRQAALHTDIEDVIIDREAGTVFLRDPEMSLDAGALAKGFAVERAMERATEAGMEAGLINAGGNVRTAGTPSDDRDGWNVGIQSPELTGFDDGNLAGAVRVKDAAVVTSGDYQRFYTVDGIRYHHIIDPETLMPARRYSSVTVIHPDSGIADMLSTALFIMPIDRGKALLSEYGGEAMWIYPGGAAEMTANFGS
ncbi:MAG: FAD:protein FMN transferase [Clostridiales bacterium]|jgi:thiamine biosynthesis lipoprotein|nr:FAD:protein FMN transferase [Clostridiales bacterium]